MSNKNKQFQSSENPTFGGPFPIGNDSSPTNPNQFKSFPELPNYLFFSNTKYDF